MHMFRTLAAVAAAAAVVRGVRGALAVGMERVAGPGAMAMAPEVAGLANSAIPAVAAVVEGLHMHMCMQLERSAAMMHLL